MSKVLSLNLIQEKNWIYRDFKINLVVISGASCSNNAQMFILIAFENKLVGKMIMEVANASFSIHLQISNCI